MYLSWCWCPCRPVAEWWRLSMNVSKKSKRKSQHIPARLPVDNSVSFAIGGVLWKSVEKVLFGKSDKNMGNFTPVSRYALLFPSGDVNSPWSRLLRQHFLIIDFGMQLSRSHRARCCVIRALHILLNVNVWIE